MITSQSEAASFESDEENVRIRLLQCKAALAQLYEQEGQLLQTPNAVSGNGDTRAGMQMADGDRYPPLVSKHAAVRERDVTGDERVRIYDVQRQRAPVRDDVRRQGVDGTSVFYESPLSFSSLYSPLPPPSDSAYVQQRGVEDGSNRQMQDIPRRNEVHHETTRRSHENEVEGVEKRRQPPRGERKMSADGNRDERRRRFESDDQPRRRQRNNSCSANHGNDDMQSRR